MSSHKLRKDKTCLNCGKFVSERYCPSCGQENIEMHYSFPQLVKHFAADLVHYDSSFWHTIKLLFVSPAQLSNEYIDGKRKKIVDPIKLYIFISFVTFLIPSILNFQNPINKAEVVEINTNNQRSVPTDSILSVVGMPPSNTMKANDHYAAKHLLRLANNISHKEQREKASEFITHNIPKVLFLYMPIFAFWLWLFHIRQKRYYSDSAIFTLYFFSFLLLMISLTNIAKHILEVSGASSSLKTILITASTLYMIWNFYRSHHIFYDEQRWKSRLKATMIGGIAVFFISVIMILYILMVFTLI